MDKKKVLRQALWEVYGRCCYYGNHSIDLRFIDIDHIIPQWLGRPRHSRKWADYSHKCRLPINFDLDSYCNLLPACKDCNQRVKRDALFKPQQAVLYLRVAGDNADKVKEKEKKLIQDVDQSKMLADLQRQQESVGLSPSTQDELKNMLRRETGQEELFISNAKAGILEVGKTTYSQISSLIKRLCNVGETGLKQLCKLSLDHYKEAYLLDIAVLGNTVFLIGISLMENPINYEVTVGIIGITLLLTEDNINAVFTEVRNLKEEYILLNGKMNQTFNNLLVNLQYITN